MNQQPGNLSQAVQDDVLRALYGDDQNDNEPKPPPEDPPKVDKDNLQLRLDKMRKQRDESRVKSSELEKKVAELSGKLDILTSNQQQEEPPEFLTDADRLAYESAQEQNSKINELIDIVNELKGENSKNNLQRQEDAFFERNPELVENRQEVVEDVLEYLNSKPALKAGLRDGSMSLNEIYGAMSSSMPSPKTKVEVKDANSTFTGSSESFGKTVNDVSQDNLLKKAFNVLSDRESTNKAVAAKAINSALVDDIIKQLG